MAWLFRKLTLVSLTPPITKKHADISILYQLAKELNQNYLLCKHHKPILAHLHAAHLLCKSSMKMGQWTKQSTIKGIICFDELTTEQLYRSLDNIEACNFEIIEQSLFEYWRKLYPKDNVSFVLDVTDTYYNEKHDTSTPSKGK